jgi:hypothetical protein
VDEGLGEGSIGIIQGSDNCFRGDEATQKQYLELDQKQEEQLKRPTIKQT